MTHFTIAAAVAVASGTATASIITPVSASGPLGIAFSDLANTINGVGLDGNPDVLSSVHSPTSPIDSYATEFIPGGPPLFISFDLGGAFDVSGVALWNQNDGGPGLAGSTGVQDVVFSFSNNGVDFFAIGGGAVAFGAEPNLSSTAQLANWSSVNAAFIGMEIVSNHGDTTFAGFAEIRFLPTPGAVAVAGLAGIAAMRRRR